MLKRLLRHWNPSATDAPRLNAGRVLVGLLASLMFALLVLPPLALLLRGLLSRGWEGLAAADAVRSALLLSLGTTATMAVLTLLFGTPLAYVLSRWQFPGKRIANLFIELPIVLPPAVAGLALLLTFGRRGLLGAPLQDVGISLPFTAAAVVLAQIFVAAPFYIRAAQIGFSGVPADIEEAARVDGASDWQVVRWITLPLSRRALAGGLVLSWARALGEFGATILFAGSLQGQTQTMPLLVYSIFERDIDAAIWTGLLLVGLALLALLVSQWLSRERFPADSH